MRRLLALVVVVAAGCAPKLANLSKPEIQQHFVLDRDHTRTEIRGPLRYKWVEGLRAGRYTLYGEDDRGRYYLGQSGSVIVLSNAAAEKYLKTGESPTRLDGGLWLPRPGVDAQPKLFYVFDPGGQRSGSGVVVDAIIQSGKGDLLFIPYGSEEEFITRLRIVEK